MPSRAKQGAKGRSILAQILLELRLEIRDPKTGRTINQAAFYRRCQEVEGPPPDARHPRTGVSFSATNPDVQRNKIGRLEKGEDDPTPGQKRIYEQICELEPNFLDQKFPSIRNFRSRRKLAQLKAARTTRKQTAVSQQRRSRDEPQNRRRRLRQLSGIRMLTDNYEVSLGRRTLLGDIQRHLRTVESKPVRIVSLQGPAGIGKSQVVAEWWKVHGQRAFVENVFSLNCERKPGDQILRALTAHFLDGQPGPVEEAIEGIRNAASPLIVLDGLATSPSRVSSLPESVLLAPTDAESVALSSVSSLIKLLADEQVPVSILVAIQTDRSDIDTLRLAGMLHAGVDFSIIPVRPLSDDDGAHMLRRLGIENVPTSDLMHISNKLMGLPISLEAAAKYLYEANPIEREQFITELNMPDRDAESFSDFFQRYMSLLYQGAQDKEAHPHAFLRLLALMPGPVPKLLIENLLEKHEIARLRSASLDQFLRNRVAFVADIDDRIDLHPLVRRFLRRELDRIVRGEITDPTTGRAEVAWIHRVAVEHCLKQLPSDAKLFTVVEADNIESAVYHLLALRELLPADRQNNIAVEQRELDDNAYREHILSLECTGGELVRYCLDRIVARYFFGRGHHFTRVLGQFETKARILTYFLEGHSLSGKAKNLSTADWCRLLLEISICWMHAGRLLIADLAIRNCIQLSVIPRTFAHDINFIISDPDSRRMWSTRSEAISAACVISMRQARSAERIQSTYGDDFAIAENIGDFAAASKAGQPLPELSRAARRLLARRAHIELLRGNLVAAIAMFGRAVDLEKISGRKWLVGDVGRRHIQALIRHAPNDKNQIALAEEILNYNYHILHPANLTQRRESNEIIPLLATRSILCRIRGDYEGSERSLREAFEHRFIRIGECTFSARMELELERARLQIARQQANADTIVSLRRQSKRLRETHHIMLAVECDLLLAELLSAEERESLLEVCERTIRGAGWLLRCVDIEAIRSGKSAVTLFHC